MPHDADDIFLFVNVKSGGGVGEAFLEVPNPLDVQLRERTVYLHVSSLSEGESGNKPGFVKLRSVVSKGLPCRVIVGGGDGSVMWVVSEALKHGIDPRSQMHLGLVPLGTGNDFAQALGWGGENPDCRALIRDDCARIKDLVHDWYRAKTELHDVWNVNMKVRPDDGCFVQREEELSEVTELNVKMCLYLGIAKDAELAYQVELHRTKSQCCNKLVYAWQGCMIAMHFFCCAGQRVQRVLRGLYAGTTSSDQKVFETGLLSQGPRLYSNPEMLLCLNINSFAGGVARDLWKDSWRVGTSDPLDDDLLDLEQDPADRKLEVLTLSRLLRVAMPTNNILAGRRVFQGAPLHFEFKQRRHRRLVTYCQVDGESYKLENPISLTITFDKQLSVLRKVAKSNPGGCCAPFYTYSFADSPETTDCSDDNTDNSDLNE
eukprot:TRINITY_DN105607_c0_g1_i1.p1 TRINITY_DN105607_c0_g1~~TRINITY_DN105607_c0_g1_i1.p1  ORF type:complete len:431 (-),score=65.70 TRINITY_DN105607_c0_g1_i1:26-1318(-)